VTNGDITAFTLDELKRRCFIGDSLGDVNVYNVLNGANIKPIAKHNAEINFILQAPLREEDGGEFGHVITCSIDGVIKITLDNDLSDSETMRTIEIDKSVIISALQYDPISKLIISGTQTGALTFWEMDTGK